MSQERLEQAKHETMRPELGYGPVAVEGRGQARLRCLKYERSGLGLMACGVWAPRKKGRFPACSSGIREATHIISSDWEHGDRVGKGETQ